MQPCGICDQEARAQRGQSGGRAMASGGDLLAAQGLRAMTEHLSSAEVALELRCSRRHALDLMRRRA